MLGEHESLGIALTLQQDVDGTTLRDDGAHRTTDRIGPGRDRPPIVTAEDVGLSIHGQQVLEGVDLRISAAAVFVLLGENGAGKTTLMRTLCGRSAPSQGRVRVEGRDPRLASMVRGLIGYVPQSIALYPELTVRENIETFRAYARQGRSMTRSARDIMQMLDLDTVAERRVGHLSGGYQRRVNLGAALAAAPAFLVLDEPTVGLDGDAKAIILEVVRSEARRGAAILLTTHDLDAAAAVADRIGILERGRIVAEGEPDDLLDRTFGGRLIVTFRPVTPVDAGLAEGLSGCGLLFSESDGSWQSPSRGVASNVVTILTRMVTSSERGLQQLTISRPGLRDLYEVMTK